MKQIPIKKNISRERIKKKAMALLNEKGFSGISVNSIVEYAGIAKGTFYIYFENKDDLIQEIFESFFEDFEKEVIGDIKNIDMKAFSTRFVDFFQGQRVFLIELRRLITQDRESLLTNRIMEFIDQSFGMLMTLSNDGEKLNVEMYSRVLATMILDVAYKAIIEENKFSNEGAIEIITDILQRYLVVNNEKSKREA